MALPSGATIRFRPPRRWNRMGMRMISVVLSSLASGRSLMPLSERHRSSQRTIRSGHEAGLEMPSHSRPSAAFARLQPWLQAKSGRPQADRPLLTEKGIV
jgi:hypothetical protein